jgi:hypothetical protein
MDIMNTSEAKDARKNTFAHGYGGGQGYTFFQFVIGLILGAATAAFFWFIGAGAAGIGIVVGLAGAMAPNFLNTHHKDTKVYIQDQVKKRTNKTLIVNDQRVPEPRDIGEVFFVDVAEFSESDPTPTND